MWEFMTKYAESFWITGEYAFEVFSVIIAWAITFGIVYFVICVFIAAAQMISHNIKELSKNNGKEE